MLPQGLEEAYKASKQSTVVLSSWLFSLMLACRKRPLASFPRKPGRI